MTRSRWTRVAAVTAVLALSACGGGGDGDLAAYCEAAAELQATDQRPSDALMKRLKDEAPDEIRGDVELAIDAIAEDGEAAFEREDVSSAVQRIEEFEERNCDT